MPATASGSCCRESLPADSIVLGHAGSIIHRSAEDTITTVEQAVNEWVV